MDLILWRHAEAEADSDDMRRRLTSKGRKQAERVGEWLLQRLPARFLLLSSPAVRAHQTAQALGMPIKVDETLAPGASVATILGVAQKHQGLVIIVGHQPDLGRAAAQLVANMRAEWHFEKGAIWWFSRGRIKAVVSPELLN